MDRSLIIALIGGVATVVSAAVAAAIARHREKERANAKERDVAEQRVLSPRSLVLPGADPAETFRATILVDDFSHVARFSDEAAKRMTSYRFEVESIAAFQTIIHELVSNAFEHGCRPGDTSIEVSSEITTASAKLVVLNAKGSTLASHMLLADGIGEPQPISPRGRGLFLASRLSDWLLMDNPHGRGRVAVGLFRDRVVISSVHLTNGITVLCVSGGIHNPSLRRRILEEIESHEPDDIIVDCGPERPDSPSEDPGAPVSMPTRLLTGSGPARAVVDANERWRNRRMVVLVGPDYLQDLLPESMVAISRKEAVGKIRKVRTAPAGV